MTETQATTETPDQRQARLAAAIADAETQYAHFRQRRLDLWAIARRDGWTYAEIGGTVGVSREAIHKALKLAGMLVPVNGAEIETSREGGDDG